MASIINELLLGEGATKEEGVMSDWAVSSAKSRTTSMAPQKSEEKQEQSHNVSRSLVPNCPSAQERSCDC